MAYHAKLRLLSLHQYELSHGSITWLQQTESKWIGSGTELNGIIFFKAGNYQKI